MIVKCKKGYLPLFDAIRHSIGVDAGGRVPALDQGRFNSIVSYVNHSREEDDWYYSDKGKKKYVRHYTKRFHYEDVYCVHLGDFIKWLDRNDTKSARLNIRLDLIRLEKHVIDIFKNRDFKGVVKKSGLFQTGNEYDINKLLIFARELESSENATDEDIVTARIALALPDLWQDYCSRNMNPWVFSSRLAILCSAVPDPKAKDRLSKEKDDEIKEKDAVIEGLKLDANLGKSRRKQLKKFGKKRGKEFSDERSKEWRKWQKEADHLTAKNAALKKNRSELARKIIKNLELKEKVQVVAKRIKI